MRLKPRTRKQLARLSVAINVLLLTVIVTRPTAVIILVLLVSVAGLGFAVGWWAVRPPANARSLAQRNRHLNRKLDATQAKLEQEMTRDG